MGYNVHDVLNCSLYYIKFKFKILTFLDMIQIVIIFQDETQNLQRIYTFLQIHIYSKMV
jgi:hypothetical protein